jgi:hypothetical protein
MISILSYPVDYVVFTALNIITPAAARLCKPKREVSAVGRRQLFAGGRASLFAALILPVVRSLSRMG